MTPKPKLAIQIGNLTLRNPLVLASGVMGTSATLLKRVATFRRGGGDGQELWSQSPCRPSEPGDGGLGQRTPERDRPDQPGS